MSQLPYQDANNSVTIAVLAVQGAFIEHEKILETLNHRKTSKDFSVSETTDSSAINTLHIKTIELRDKKDLSKHYDGLILPGGESTTQGKLLRELGMFDTLKSQIRQGLPVLATCAGLILLADKLENDDRTHFQTLPVTVKRNAYGRQLGSFYTEGEMKGIGTVPMTFIRAPYISNVSDTAIISEPSYSTVNILAKIEDCIVAVRYKNQLALSFHPELNKDTRIHEYFIGMVREFLDCNR